jgi:regulator of nonsense transcripts 3
MSATNAGDSEFFFIGTAQLRGTRRVNANNRGVFRVASAMGTPVGNRVCRDAHTTAAEIVNSRAPANGDIGAVASASTASSDEARCSQRLSDAENERYPGQSRDKKEKRMAPLVSTKLVIRRLPAGLTLDQLRDALGEQWDALDVVDFVPGSGKKYMGWSRAYVTLKSDRTSRDAVIRKFKQHVEGVEALGASAVVALAPFGLVNNGSGRDRVNTLEGTMEDSEAFKVFLEWFERIRAGVDAETGKVGGQREDAGVEGQASGDLPIRTVLMDHMEKVLKKKQKAAKKGGKKSDAQQGKQGKEKVAPGGKRTNKKKVKKDQQDDTGKGNSAAKMGKKTNGKSNNTNAVKDGTGATGGRKPAGRQGRKSKNSKPPKSASGGVEPAGSTRSSTQEPSKEVRPQPSAAQKPEAKKILKIATRES